jgi:hypothetical protein
MVGVVDLKSTHESTTGDLAGLWVYLQQIVGEPFLILRETYGGELTLHLGAAREAASPKLRHRTRGSYVLTLRASNWSFVTGSQLALSLADPSTEPGLPFGPSLAPDSFHPQQVELADLEKKPPIAPGVRIESAKPFLVDFFSGIGLFLVFEDQSRLTVRPSVDPSPGNKEDSPEIADWELFTPHGRYLRVGPGSRWAYLPSGGEETISSAGNEEMGFEPSPRSSE